MLSSWIFRSEMTLEKACCRSFVIVPGLGVMLLKLNFGFVWFFRMNELRSSDLLPSSLKTLDMATRVFSMEDDFGRPRLNFPGMEIFLSVPSRFFARFGVFSKIYLSLPPSICAGLFRGLGDGW